MEILDPKGAIIKDVNNFMSNISQKAKLLAKQSLSQYQTKNVASQNSIMQNPPHLSMSEYSKLDIGSFDQQHKNQTGKIHSSKISEVEKAHFQNTIGKNK